MSKFLDLTGVTYLWGKAKAYFATKTHTHKVADISDLSTSLNGKVPTTRKVNGKALSADITLSAADVSAIPTSQKGAPSGVAELDGTGKVPSSQLPSYVDDTVEGYLNGSKFYKDSGHEEEISGEAGKIYVDLATNKTYRWSSTTFVEISASLALGATSSTAFRGDQGKTAYDHAYAKGAAFTAGFYKITTNAQGHVTAATEVAKEDITALGIPGSDTTYTAMTSAEISTGTATTARTISAKVLNDWIGTKIGTSIETITEEEIDAICV